MEWNALGKNLKNGALSGKGKKGEVILRAKYIFGELELGIKIRKRGAGIRIPLFFLCNIFII